MRMRKMNYPVPVPQQLTVYVHEIDFPGNAPLIKNPYQWEQLAFPFSWKNISKASDDTPSLRVERIIFSLCCGAVAAYLKYFDSVYAPEDWFDILEPIGKKGALAVFDDGRGQISETEFLNLINAVCDLFHKKHYAKKRTDNIPKNQFQQESSRFLQHFESCKDYISFLCSQQSREMLAKYLPPVDPTDRQLIQLGIRIQIKFIVPLDTVLIGENYESQTTWFTEFYRHYLNICGSTPFLTLDWGLSSGEENLLKMFTNLQEVYLPTGQKEPMICNAGKQSKNSVYRCTSIWLFLDEADLTYHPEWQRQFMAILTTFLQEVYPPNICQEMQVFLSTHSPLMLGDFPGRCVAYLRHKNDGTRYVDDSGCVDTFGENLFTLLHDSFYLQKGEIGELAKRKIENVLIFLENTRQKLKSSKLMDTDKENIYRLLQKYRDETVVLLADGPIKTKLWSEINRLENQMIRRDNDRNRRIRMLEETLKRLKEDEDSI